MSDFTKLHRELYEHSVEEVIEAVRDARKHLSFMVGPGQAFSPPPVDESVKSKAAPWLIEDSPDIRSMFAKPPPRVVTLYKGASAGKSESFMPMIRYWNQTDGMAAAVESVAERLLRE